MPPTLHPDGIIELSTGHVFVRGSVKAIALVADGEAAWEPIHVKIYGVGFTVDVYKDATMDDVERPQVQETAEAQAAAWDAYDARRRAARRDQAIGFHKECIRKLMG